MDIQARLTYQEEDLRVLNEVVVRQRNEIDALREEIARLRHRIRSLAESSPLARTAEPPPPHY